MDQAMVDWAVTAMDFGDDTVRAEQWFKLLAAAYQDPDESEPVGGWDEFVDRLNLAAEREGFDSTQVQFFVENLRDAASDPIGDVVLPMYEQRDTLPQEYLELRAASAAAQPEGAVDQDAAAAESEWHWDDAQQVWHHLENNEWVPQLQNGLALNYERTAWVAAEPAAVAEKASADQEWRWDEARQVWDHLEGDEWVPQIQNGYALNYDRNEWVAVEADAPAETAGVDESAEPTEQPVFEPLSEEEQAEALAELDKVDEVLESVAPAIEDAVMAIDGIELGDLTDEQIEQMLNRLLSEAPSAA